jgi:2,5-diketo-D-gluconate reductase B
MFEGSQQIGLGTYANDDFEECVESVKNGLSVGYRHIDTAQMYENEAAVGEGISQSSVSREDIFVATKVDPHNLGYDDVISSTEASLDRLGIDVIDLHYVHWPNETYDVEETMAAFEELHERGLINNVGVSNFSSAEVRAAQRVCDAEIVANQVEMHPLYPQRDLRAELDDLGIELVAYCPLARGEIFDVPVLNDIAHRHGVSVPQVSLAWALAKDVVPIPKASSRDHLEDNFEALTLELDTEEIQRIDAIDQGERIVPGYDK